MSNADRFQGGRGGTVTSRPLEPAPAVTLWGVILAGLRGMPYAKLFALALWCVGLACTRLTAALFFDDVALQWGAAIIAQGALTMGQSPIWRRWEYDGDTEYRRDIGFWHIQAFLWDVIVNLGGTVEVVERFHEFPPVLAIVRLLSGEAAPPLDPIVGLPALILALLCGGFLAAAPEKLWYL